MSQSIYFARFGKIFGPFNSSEVEKFHQNGTIHDFSWMWDNALKTWKALDPAPAQKMNTPQDSKKHSLSSEILPVVCFSNQTVVIGQMDQVTETGCLLSCTEKGLTPLQVNSLQASRFVYLQIEDQQTGKQLKLQAKVMKANYQRGKTDLIIRWESKPNIL